MYIHRYHTLIGQNARILKAILIKMLVFYSPIAHDSCTYIAFNGLRPMPYAADVEEEDEVVDTSKNNKIFKEKVVTHDVHAPFYPIVCVLITVPFLSIPYFNSQDNAAHHLCM